MCRFMNYKGFISYLISIAMSLNLYTIEMVVSFTQVSHFGCRSLNSGMRNSEVVAKLRNKKPCGYFAITNGV